MEIISEGGQYTYFKSNPTWEKIAVQLGNIRLGSGYFDHLFLYARGPLNQPERI